MEIAERPCSDSESKHAGVYINQQQIYLLKVVFQGIHVFDVFEKMIPFGKNFFPVTITLYFVLLGWYLE